MIWVLIGMFAALIALVSFAAWMARDLSRAIVVAKKLRKGDASPVVDNVTQTKDALTNFDIVDLVKHLQQGSWSKFLGATNFDEMRNDRTADDIADKILRLYIITQNEQEDRSKPKTSDQPTFRTEVTKSMRLN